VWGYETLLTGAVGKRPRAASDCPPETPQCTASNARFQLVNARDLSEVRGIEGALRVRLPIGLSARATVAFAWGEGPNLGDPPSDPAIPFNRRVPLSRIPPVNGSVEARWSHRVGVAVGAALRWAGPQSRLAVADRSDARIPVGGTPGFAVLDLRASYRVERRLVLALVFENVIDSTYRYHGSSVNGPGRGVLFSLEFSPF
jgi:outer membrane receptor protein involved in Fe transport